MTAHATTHANGQQPTNQESTPKPTRGLNPLQRDYLLKPLDAHRIRDVQGMSHLEAHDVRRWLTRVFGFGGWSLDTLGLDLIAEHRKDNHRKKGRNGEPYGPEYTAWTVVYRAQVRLTVKDPVGNVLTHFDDAATGDAINMPSIGDAHDFAVKTAMSQAMKRCAVNLGDQFGLSLYDGGGVRTPDGQHIRPAVQATLDRPRTTAPTHDDQPVQPEPEPEHERAA
jgi:recombination DNA repair RAD52 pathway protein